MKTVSLKLGQPGSQAGAIPPPFSALEEFEDDHDQKGDREQVGSGLDAGGIHENPSKRVLVNSRIIKNQIENMEYITPAINSDLLKDQSRSCHAYEGPLGEVVHKGQYFFAWKKGRRIGICSTLEEAMECLRGGKGEAS